MGRAKALLEYGGRTFVEHLAALYSGLGEVVITVNAGLFRELSQLDVGARLAVNPRPEDGLFSSVRLGLEELAGHGGPIFVTPVDCLLPDGGVLHALLDAARQDSDVLVPTHAGKRGHPVLLQPTAFAPLVASEPTAHFGQLLDDLAIVEVPVDSEWIHLNVNTPADYTQFLEKASQRRREL